MTEFFEIPKLRKTAAILALSGAALGLSGCESDEKPQNYVHTAIEGDTLNKVINIGCQDELGDGDMSIAIIDVVRHNNLASAQIRAGQKIEVPKSACDTLVD